MTSEIDPSIIQDNIRVNKADLREQLQIAKNEISELQKRSSPAFNMAFGEDFGGSPFNMLDPGATSLTDNGVVYGNGTDPVSATAEGATGTLLGGQTGSPLVFQTGQVAAEAASLGYAVANLAGLKGLTSRPLIVNVQEGRAAGTWWWDDGSATTPDDGITVQCTNGPAGRYKRNYLGGRSPIWYGAAADGVTDDTAAIQATIDSYGATRGQVIFGPYPYKVSGNIQVLQGSIHLKGAGKTVTDIFVTDGTSFVFKFGGTTFDSSITGMRIIYVGGGTPSAGAAIRETDGVGAITIQGIRIEGLWRGVQCDNTPNLGISGVVKIYDTDIANVEDDGIYVDGISQLFTQGLTTTGLPPHIGVGNAGIHIVHGGGFYINNTTCGGTDYGFLVNPGNGQLVYNIFMTNYESDACGIDGYHFDTTGTGRIETVLMAAVRAGFCTRYGLVMNGNIKAFRMIGPEIQKCGEHGIFILGGNGIEIDAAYVCNNGSLVAGRYGINIYGGDNIAFNGGMGATYQTESPTQDYHLVVQSAFTGTLLVDGFNATGEYVTGGIFNASMSTGVKIINSPGFNPRGFLIPSVGASPWTYTAGASDESIILTGGTVSQVDYEGNNTLLTTPATFVLPAGKSMTVTYTVAPAVCAIGT